MLLPPANQKLTTIDLLAAIGAHAADADAHHAQVHTLDGADHQVSGLTAGHFLKALSSTTFGFGVHGLGYGDVGAVGLQGATPGTQQTGHDNLSGTRIAGSFVAQALAALTTPAESWVGPSSTTGLYFKGGNVGIGTTSPATQLQLDASGSNRIRFSEGGTFRGELGISSGITDIFSPAIPDNALGIRGDGGIYLGTGTAANLTITTAGNVGIGTTSPQQLLHLSSSDPQIQIIGTTENSANSGRLRLNEYSTTAGSYLGGFVHYDGSANVLNIGVHNVDDKLTANDINAISILRSSGNVGIGTTNPIISGSGKLHMAADTFRLNTARTPASAGAAGNAGEFCWDANYLYLCIATNTWHRIAHVTWP